MSIRDWIHSAWASISVMIALTLSVGCGASIDPAMKRLVDQRVAGRAKSMVYEPPTVSAAPEPKENTWALYKVIDDDGQPSLLTYKMLRREGDKFWIEITSETYYGRSIQLMRVDFGPRMSPEDIEVDRVLEKTDDNEVQVVPEALLGMMAGLYRPALAMLAISWLDLPQEDVTVGAGTFRQAYKKRVDTSVAGFSDSSEVWLHDAVPVGGAVRSRSLESRRSMELLDMGINPVPTIPIP